MDNDILSLIALVCVFSSPFVALIGIIIFKIYRKFRPASKAARVEKPWQEKLAVPSMLPKPPHPLPVALRFVVLAALAVFSGLFIGFMVSLVSKVIYMSIVFPLGMGAAGGSILADGARRLRVRKSHALTILAVLLAVIIYGTFHYSSYVLLQFQTSEEIRLEAPDMTEGDSLAISRIILDDTFEERTGQTGFVGYILYQAKKGVEVGRFYYRSRTNLGPVLTWFYWLLEFVIILGAILIVGAMYSSEEVCEFCGNWYREVHLGGTSANNQDAVLDRVRRKEFADLGSMLAENAEVPSLELYLHGCEACNQGSSRLIVRRTSLPAGGTLQFTDLSKTVLPPAERARLVHAFGSAPVTG